MARFPKHYKKQYDMAQRAEKTLLPPPLLPKKLLPRQQKTVNGGVVQDRSTSCAPQLSDAAMGDQP
jgi:hypothetical protein